MLFAWVEREEGKGTGIHVEPLPARDRRHRTNAAARAAAVLPPVPPTCESNTELPKFDGSNTSRCSDTGVGCGRRERTREVTIAS